MIICVVHIFIIGKGNVILVKEIEKVCSLNTYEILCVGKENSELGCYKSVLSVLTQVCNDFLGKFVDKGLESSILQYSLCQNESLLELPFFEGNAKFHSIDGAVITLGFMPICVGDVRAINRYYKSMPVVREL